MKSLCRLLSAFLCVVAPAGAADREPGEPEGEHHDEDQARPEHRHGDADQRQDQVLGTDARPGDAGEAPE